MSKPKKTLFDRHPLPWTIVDPNGRANTPFPTLKKGYRPVWLEDKSGQQFLYVGDASKQPSVLVLAKYFVTIANAAV